jgi:hypothetical protein
LSETLLKYITMDDHVPQHPHYPLRSFEDIQPFDELRRSCNDIIDELAKANRTSEFADTGDAAANLATLKAFFAEVFSRGWNTLLKIDDRETVPTFRQARVGRNIMVQVGVFRLDCRPSKKALQAWQKDRASDTNAPMPKTSPQRLAGQPVYVKCIVDVETEGLSFLYIDSKHQTVNSRYILWHKNMDEVTASAVAVRRWDLNEIKRVGSFNMELAVALVRNRLIGLQCHHDNNVARVTLLPEEDLDRFVQVKTASDELDRLNAIITEAERLAAENPLPMHRLIAD